jgi:hypothetical protein
MFGFSLATNCFKCWTTGASDTCELDSTTSVAAYKAVYQLRIEATMRKERAGSYEDVARLLGAHAGRRIEIRLKFSRSIQPSFDIAQLTWRGPVLRAAHPAAPQNHRACKYTSHAE